MHFTVINAHFVLQTLRAPTNDHDNSELSFSLKRKQLRTEQPLLSILA
jgi:hypothetical protein